MSQNSVGSDPIVGIDLGTTNSVVAAVINGKPQVFSIDGLNWMPSVVGLSPSGSLITGVVAKNQLAAFSEKTVASIKRKMGTAETVTLGDQNYTPAEISAMILRRLKDVASRNLGQEVKRAVITVPAYFNEHQRQATRQAGELAGLSVERIINEPTAATLVYHVDKHDRKIIAVYDFGGGTFDVSVVRVEAGVIEVLASQGDTKLGGDDIDHLLLDYVAAEFEKRHGIDLRKEPQSKYRVLQACERAKIALSELESVVLAEEFMCEKNGEPLHLQVSLSRSQLDEMIMPLVERTLVCVGNALRDASVSIHQIDDLVLVGGSTRIPLVADELRNQFMRQPSRSVDPDLAVALGAAVQAAMLQGENVGPVLVDVATHTLGLEVCVGYNDIEVELGYAPIIHRGSALPARYEEAFAKMHPRQEFVEIPVLQGENRNPSRNTLIGKVKLNVAGESPESKKILVAFNLTLDGVLRVTAKHPATGRVEELEIDNALSQLSLEERQEAKGRLISLFEQSEQLSTTQDWKESEEFLANFRVDDGVAASLLERPHVYQMAKERFPKALSLLEKAEAMKQQMQGEDAEEFFALREKLYTAIESNDETMISNLSADLDDLLFYVQ